MRLFVPEVLQTSAVDCGPAALKCILEGFGVPASYGRLREACQTDVDGTSIDTLEEVAAQLGLKAEQVVLPVDHLLLEEARALPAIVLVRLPNGSTHFVVVWSRRGRFVQVMDPTTGRLWQTRERLLRSVYVHTLPVSADAWRSWAGSDGFLRPLERRLASFGALETGRAVIAEAMADPTWCGLAELDAATRMVESLVRAGGLRRGRQARGALQLFLHQARRGGASDIETIPETFWSVRPVPGTDGRATVLLLTGAVLLGVKGLSAEAPASRSPELEAALKEPPARPARELLHQLRADGLLTPAALLAALVASSLGTLLEAVLFRGLFDIGRFLGLVGQRLWALGALVAVLAALLLIDLPIAAGAQRLGRRLEARLRVAFLEKLPRLSDRYFQSRPTSDMAERSHILHRIRQLPSLGVQLVRAVLGLCVTTTAIAWLAPESAPLAIGAALAGVALPLVLQPKLSEQDLRLRTHAGALSRFYLDALLGLTAVRTHGAERSVRREHESLLVEWSRAGRAFQRWAAGAEALQALVGFGLSALLFWSYLTRHREAAGSLLLLYWALSLPLLGQELCQLARQYPLHRNITLRLLEPLGALEPAHHEPSPAAEPSARKPSVAIQMLGLQVKAAGRVILDELDLDIEAGSHVAIVGPSGAGKSSLVGLLLGWHRPASGNLLVDGEALEGDGLRALRRETVWVDPAVQLWNRSLLENLSYGARGTGTVRTALEGADLHAVLERLPEGLQTPLGEGGALLSGGEGQRVRLGRAMLKPNPRLVILDEPFRGLDRERRRELLRRARERWREATLLCITHDIGETRGFDRVLVVDGGRVVEDGAPDALAESEGSRYRALLEAEEAVRGGLWSNAAWRRLRIDTGVLSEARGVEA